MIARDPRDERRAERRERVLQSLHADGDCCAADGPIQAADGCCSCRADRVQTPEPGKSSVKPAPAADASRLT